MAENAEENEAELARYAAQERALAFLFSSACGLQEHLNPVLRTTVDYLGFRILCVAMQPLEKCDFKCGIAREGAEDEGVQDGEVAGARFSVDESDQATANAVRAI